MGWVHRRRDLGNLIFIDVRDRGGIAQIVFNKELGAAAHARAEELRSEYVIAVRGNVAPRAKPNPELPSGEVEIFATELRLLNTAKTPPFVIEDEVSATEETRLRYRYLDMRRPQLQRNLALRHRVVLEMRRTLDALGFLSKSKTPMLTRSTPEGARDYLVPSRVHHALFLRAAAIAADVQAASDDRRLRQIFSDRPLFPRCDEKTYAPTCSTISSNWTSKCPSRARTTSSASSSRYWFASSPGRALPMQAMYPSLRMEYREAIKRFGSDKPDLRFGMELCDVTQHFAAGREKLRIEGNVQAMAAPGASAFSLLLLDRARRAGQEIGRARPLHCEGHCRRHHFFAR